MEHATVAVSDIGDIGDIGELREIVTVDTVESLFRAHYGRLVRALTLVGGSRELAADAVQEAFVKAHLHWRRISRYDDPVGWIRRVAINRLRDDHRRQTRKAHAEQRMSNERPVNLEPTIDESAQLLAELPRQQRLAMALYYVDGMSVVEVATAMKLSTGAVKFHLHQGRERLRGSVAIAQDAR
ncbi:MAG: polymerase sigma factor, sigma-70 family [Ilumatobacteraceae bacterium]|nr:polymerase sigma factor, sigma-70 family [Ilumatobacteraceae bacterium]